MKYLGNQTIRSRISATALPALVLAVLLSGVAPAGAQSLEFSPRDDYASLVFEPVLLDETAADGIAPGSAAEESPEEATSARATDVLARIEGYEDLIRQTVEDEGLFSENLRQHYQSLALALQDTGQHEEAVSTFEKAIHIARVNDGLFTVRQIDDVQGIVESLAAIRDAERETEYRGYLYYVQQKSYPEGDPRLLAARREWAQWNMRSYIRSFTRAPYRVLLPGRTDVDEVMIVHNTLTGELRFVERDMSTMTGTARASDYAVPLDMVLDSRLREARDLYERTLEEDTSRLSPEQLEEVHLNLAATYYSLKSHVEMMLEQTSTMGRIGPGTTRLNSVNDINRTYSQSVDIMEELVAATEEAKESDPVALARALRNLGDLELVYGHRHRAVSAYTRLWELSEEAGVDTQTRARLLSNTPLVIIPEFVIHPYSRAFAGVGPDEKLEYLGHIDVRFSINEYGELKAVDVQETSEGTPYEVRRRLVEHLRSIKARPRIESGQTAETDERLYRFYYSY